MPFTPARIAYSLFTCCAPMDLARPFALHRRLSVFRAAQRPTTQHAILCLCFHLLVLDTSV